MPQKERKPYDFQIIADLSSYGKTVIRDQSAGIQIEVYARDSFKTHQSIADELLDYLNRYQPKPNLWSLPIQNQLLKKIEAFWVIQNKDGDIVAMVSKLQVSYAQIGKVMEFFKRISQQAVFLDTYNMIVKWNHDID